MKYTLAFILMTSVTFLKAQTMKWVPLEAGIAKGPCIVAVDPKQIQLCYALEYTPGVSGVLTSYTTGFLVSCTSMGSAISKNQSCSMTGQVRMMNGCEDTGVVLLNSSGHSGTNTDNKVEAGVPVILHQVCFSIPYGESITIREDLLTDLTTSINLNSGLYQTEFPAYTELRVQRDRFDASRPVWLDFKGIPAGDLISQLDWSTSEEINNSHFVIERSMDGNEFVAIGRTEPTERPAMINSYQFFDKAAMMGNNYYRLQQVDRSGKIVFSPVRLVYFSERTLSVKVSPNPADTYIQVDLKSPVTGSMIKLIDVTGRVVMEEKNENKMIKARLDVKKLNPGIYTLAVETDQEKYSEKVVIAH